jgi:cysteine-rich repeat protein
MAENRLITLALVLISMLAVACGDAGGNPGFDDPGLGEDGGNGGVDGDDGGTGGVGGDDGGEGGQGGEGGEPDPEPVPFCGDGLIDEDEQCDDGNEEDGDGCSSACEEEVVEPIETEGDIAIHIVIDNLNSPEAPAEDDCPGSIALVIDAREITGDGVCSLVENANSLSYSLDADVDADGVVDGVLEITLNGTPHLVPVEGSFVDGMLAVEFLTATLVTANIRAVWSGEINADLD